MSYVIDLLIIIHRDLGGNEITGEITPRIENLKNLNYLLVNINR